MLRWRFDTGGYPIDICFLKGVTYLIVIFPRVAGRGLHDRSTDVHVLRPTREKTCLDLAATGFNTLGDNAVIFLSTHEQFALR